MEAIYVLNNRKDREPNAGRVHCCIALGGTITLTVRGCMMTDRLCQLDQEWKEKIN